MAKRIWNKTRRLDKDGDAGPVSDGSVTVRQGGTTNPLAVYTDQELTEDVSGSVINFNSNGYLEVSGNLVNLYVADDVTADLYIQATDFNGSVAVTEEDASIADSAVVSEDYRTGFKNALTNGDFASWSGATSGNNASGDDDGDETADGWFLAQPSAASNEWSRQSADGTGARYGFRFGRPSSSTSANEIRLWKILALEEAYRLRSQTVTLSFSAKAGANFSGTSLSVKLATGTTESEDGDGIKAASWGGFALPISQNVTLTETITRFSYTATLAPGIKEVGVQFAFTGAGTAGANDWVQIEDVQVEIGATASAFESPPELLTYLLNKMASVGRTLVRQTSQALMRTTGLGMSSDGSDLVTKSNANMRAQLDLEAGTDFLSPAAIAAAYQPLDQQLSAWAGYSPSAGSMPYWDSGTTLAELVSTANGRAILSAANYAAMRALLDLEPGTDFVPKSGGTFTGDVVIDHASAPLLDLRLSGVSKAQLFVSSTSNFLLGAAGQQWLFYANNNLGMTLDASLNLTVVGTVTGSSDAKFKTEIEDLSEQEAIEFLCGLRPRTFRKHGVRLVGFIAQEVAQVDQRYVFENENIDESGELIGTYLSIPAGAEWAAPLVMGFQALARRVAALEAR